MITLKKFFAALMAGTIATGMISPLQTEAYRYIDITQLIVNKREPVRWFQYDDKYGSYDFTLGTWGDVYKVYRNIDYTGFLITFDPIYNCTSLQISDLEKFNSIYAEYEDELGFDSFNVSQDENGISSYMYDIYDENGSRSFDKAANPVKLDLIQEMCNEMQAADAIFSGEYIYCRTTNGSGGTDMMSIDLGETITYDSEGVKELVDAYGYTPYVQDKRYISHMNASFETTLALTEEILELYPDSKVTPMLGIQEGGGVETFQTPIVNLLTGDISSSDSEQFYPIDITKFDLESLEGLTRFEDIYEMYDYVGTTFKSEYILYRQEDSGSFKIMFQPLYNLTVFELKDKDIFNEYYTSFYEEELGFDSLWFYNENGVNYAQVCTQKNAEGNWTFNPEDYPVQLDALQKMSSELKELGAISSATYNYCIAEVSDGGWNGRICFDDTQLLAADEIDSLVQKYDAEYSTNSLGQVTQIQLNSGSFDTALELTDEILAQYPDCGAKPECTVLDLALPSITTPTIDLLTGAVIDGASEYLKGDVDQNGIVEISDASDILLKYAQIGAGLAEYDENYDYDGNGTVDISDATEVLTIYAKSGAGLI
ncbi:MAG: hypothetical protein IJ496_10180 [Ruminococcus sp.]|nr:hypothetical protein [Ruminococcus sp.]